MEQCCITFRSVTYAQRGEALLERRGIPVRLRRTPGWMEEQGCGYCLGLGGETLRRAQELLRTHGVPVRRVYVRGPGKEWKELVP